MCGNNHTMKKLFIVLIALMTLGVNNASAQAKPKPAPAATAKMTKDGKPDRRYKENKGLKQDGTPDKRFKAHKAKK